MSISHSARPSFVDRFDRLYSRARRASLGQSLCLTVLLVTLGFIALVAADYVWEIERQMRLIGFSVLAAVSVVALGTMLVMSIRRWNQARTVAKLERSFPELGQAVRTSVEYGKRSEEELRREGVAIPLVRALTSETQAHAAPLPLENVVPAKGLYLAAAAMLLTIGLVIAGVSMDQQWRTATSRVLLNETPYTEVEVTPGSVKINEGEGVDLKISVLGRTNRQVFLMTRSPNAPEIGWSEIELTDSEVMLDEPAKKMFVIPMPKIEEPLEYQVVAGPAISEIHRIDVRFPLSIIGLAAHVTPPEYTGIEPTTDDNGNLNVIDGSQVDFEIELDRQPVEAAMIISDIGGSRRGAPLADQRIPLTIEGSKLLTSISFSEDKSYSIEASSDDGMTLPANRYRVRVRYDQPPQVWFESPRESLEVHGLAEVMLRIRTRDDFGLTRSGIVFEVNNEEEYTLLEKDYRKVMEELAAAGEDVGNQTRDALQRLLPLEFFGLTQKDSVTFYAFAEDNLPGMAHRTETDLQFIDIRPFRRFYRLPDPNGNGDGMNNDDDGPQVRSLQELINRQRFNLNRTIRLEKRVAAGEDPALSLVDRIASFEDEVASSTRQLAEFLRRFDFEDLDLLFQAETSMLSAVDSLGVGKYDISHQQQKDALRLLIEARNSIEVQLRGASSATRQALSGFSRMQVQQLRRGGQNNQDNENAEQLADRIRQLAARQERVAEAMTAMADPDYEEPAPGSSSDEPAEDADSGTADEPAEPAEEPADSGNENEPSDDDPSAEPSEEGEDAPEMEAPPEIVPSELTRQDVEELQQDIAIEARDIESVINRNRDLSALARDRASAAADMSDEAYGQFVRGQTGEAAETADETAALLRELALQIQGLTASEATQKIAMSRDLAGGLSAAERRVAEETQAAMAGAGEESEEPEEPTEEEVRAALIKRANRLAETGMTLEDILVSIAESNSRRESEAVRAVDDILAEGDLSDAVQEMRAIAIMIEEKNEEAPVNADAVADALSAAARKLDQIYRATVTPRTERLMQLEQRAAGLEADLEEMETDQQVSGWHVEAMDLLEDVDEAGAADVAPDELYEAMQDGRSSRVSPTDWNWEKNSEGTLKAPEDYGKATRKLVEELQQQLQEVILVDMASDRDEGAPPKYRHLIDRYLEVLSADVE